ncbi:MAG TPA: MarR family transcriptional regulator [Bacilli bacterium]
MRQVDREAAQKMMHAFMQFRKVNWHQWANAGRKPSEIMVMRCLYRCASSDMPGMKVHDISNFLHVTSPTVTQLVNELEKDGLVERKMDPADRRAIRVTLTSAGMAVVQEASAHFIALFGGLVAHLGKERSEQLVELLNEVFDYFQEEHKGWDQVNRGESEGKP